VNSINSLIQNDRLARILAGELKILINDVQVGDEFEVLPDSDVCSSLELFMPQLLRMHYPAWETESLDGIFVEKAVRDLDHTVILIGCCILINDQTLTPFYARMSVSSEKDLVLSCTLRLGEPGGGVLGISGPQCTPREVRRYRSLLLNRFDSIEWVYEA
jgi:hypothetical protein